MKYKVQHLGRNNLQDETSVRTAGSQISFKRSQGDTGQKQGKDFMLISVCSMSIEMCTIWRDYGAANKENDDCWKKLSKRKDWRNGIIYL